MKKVLFIGLCLMFQFSYSLSKTNTLDNQVKNGLDNGLVYLNYAVWASAVLGGIAVAFMLFGNMQEAILKTVVRVVAVIGVAAMAYVIPGWFGLNVNF